ncbi:MAG TPA: hypothetical protein VGJ36_10405 [Gemmatimonadales bacterium]|jgi:hypothetical protein
MRILAWAYLELLLAAAGCASPDADTRRAETERKRDSLIGESRLPGAGGVRGALRAQDSAAARNLRVDSVANQP